MPKKEKLKEIKYRGRFSQMMMYLNKFFRMFIFMNDWKVLPMSALVAGLVTVVVYKSMFVTMEGTAKGALALTCICIWNGFFNSIQSICRERDIVKREHRNGMHVTSYVAAHMIYQALICLAQSIITIGVCMYSGMKFPTESGIVYGFYPVDLCITLFIITYSADMMSLMISAIAKSTTSAMTVMPFMLIFQLVFSNTMFKVGEKLTWITDFSLAKWGVRCISAQSYYNSLPTMTLWNQMNKWKDMEYNGTYPIAEMMLTMDKDEFCMKSAEKSQVADYVSSVSNVTNCWISLLMFAFLFAVVAVLALKRIDKDKR